MNDTLVIIPIRLKASRFPNKPFAHIGDVPMLHYVYNRVSAFTENLYLAICDQEVKNYCEKMDLQYVMTDPDHLSGSDRIGEAVKKIEEDIKFKYVINVQGDMPYISPEQIVQCHSLVKQFDVGTLIYDMSSQDQVNPNSVKCIGVEHKRVKHNVYECKY